MHIRIITHRLFIPHFHRIAASETTWGLDYYGYRDPCFMKKKGLVDASLYIDDTPSNICDLLAYNKKVIVFSNSTNIDMDVELSTDSWLKVEEIVESQRTSH